MKNKTKIIKEIYFCADKETAKIYNLEYSERQTQCQVLLDYDKNEIRIFFKSTWNSDYNQTEIIPL